MYDLVFVYGTLMPGQAAHAAHAGLFTGTGRPATTEGTLYHLPAGYPTLLLEPGPAPVCGVVLRLADPRVGLPLLDAYEDCDPKRPDTSLYARALRTVRPDAGEAIVAWIYHAPPFRKAAVRRLGRPVPGGDWAAFRESG